MNELKNVKRYKCHKEVQAFKIEEINDHHNPDIVATQIIKGEGVTIALNVSWLNKHRVEIGGYIVIYKDGYTSFSPAKAFEDGYTEL